MASNYISQADMCKYLEELWVSTYKHETLQSHRTWIMH